MKNPVKNSVNSVSPLPSLFKLPKEKRQPIVEASTYDAEQAEKQVAKIVAEKPVEIPQVPQAIPCEAITAIEAKLAWAKVQPIPDRPPDMPEEHELLFREWQQHKHEVWASDPGNPNVTSWSTVFTDLLVTELHELWNTCEYNEDDIALWVRAEVNVKNKIDAIFPNPRRRYIYA